LATGLHGAARTTPRVRAELQVAKESARTLATRYGLNAKTVAKWRKRTSTADLPMGPSKPKSTVLSESSGGVPARRCQRRQCALTIAIRENFDGGGSRLNRNRAVAKHAAMLTLECNAPVDLTGLRVWGCFVILKPTETGRRTDVRPIGRFASYRTLLSGLNLQR
jgi:hypothetical protein